MKVASVFNSAERDKKKMRHYFAERDKQSGKPFIRFLDEPDENEGEEEVVDDHDASLAVSSTTTTNPLQESSDILAPLSESPVQQEHFLYAHPREVRSTYFVSSEAKLKRDG
jgi:hypothetical protein